MIVIFAHRIQKTLGYLKLQPEFKLLPQNFSSQSHHIFVIFENTNKEGYNKDFIHPT